ncbi:sensor histidine kinase, partial [Oxalicibacterium faecigallinarum]|uniref:sensor histidine kinase n=1 Tax=Oxalicibacterium faecigallinarum TaxID=573741 RepID=UPI00280BD920
MMKRKFSLQRRITTAMLLMAFALCSFFSLVAYVAVEISESQLIDHRLDKEADRLIDQHINNRPPDPEEVNFFINSDIPEYLSGLPEGLHEVMHDGKEITVIVRKVNDETFVITDDTSDFEITEILIFMSIGAGFLASILLAIILGMAFARRIVSPVTELADAVARNEEPGKLPSLDAQDEIGMLARTFAARTEQLQQFLADEKLFTGDVSHELRTPLTIMLGAAELLETRLAQSPDDLEVATRIRRIASEASERVGALLLLSQSPEMLGSAPLPITHVIEREIERYRPMIEDKPVTVEFTGSPDVLVPARVELAGIAIGNLIRNACQYTEQGCVRIKLTQDRLVIEDLNIQGMLTNHSLAAAISDAAWGELARQLANVLSGDGPQPLQCLTGGQQFTVHQLGLAQAAHPGPG